MDEPSAEEAPAERPAAVAPEASPGQRAAIQRRTLGILLVAQVLGSLGVGASAALDAIVAYQVTESEASAGLSRTVATFAAAAFGVPMALLAVRRGRRTSLGLGWLLAAIGAGAQIVAMAGGGLTILLVGLVIFGGGKAASLQSRFAATDLEVPHRRTRSLSLIVWATTVGIVLGPNLVTPGEPIGRSLGLSPLAGAYCIALVAFVLAAVVTWLGLRPDPLVTAQGGHLERRDRSRRGPSTRVVLGRILAQPRSRFAFWTLLLNHTVMVVMMTMSAVHLHDQRHSLTLIGLTISLHTLGMYAFSPLVGQLADRWGKIPTALLGQAINVAALVFCFLAGASLPLTMAGLFLLGLGWSGGMVAGSALLSESVGEDWRTQAQGTGDTAMNFAAGIAAGVAGPVMSAFGFPWLTVVALCFLVPILVLGADPRLRR